MNVEDNSPPFVKALPLDVKIALLREQDIGRPLAYNEKYVPHFLEHPEDFLTLAKCHLDPREFLKHWYVQTGGREPFLLGAELWDSQEQFLQAWEQHLWIYFLKARQLGQSTLMCAMDGWHARFGPPNARVHIISRIGPDAIDLMNNMTIFGLDQLPEWMQLPKLRDTVSEKVYSAGPGDTRTLHAWPSENPGRGYTPTLVHLDEWAAIENPSRVYAAIEPSVAKDGGRFIILTTGVGPESYTAKYWQMAIIDKTAKHYPCFINALSRPGQDMAWYQRELASQPDATSFKREHPLKWPDALKGLGDLFFESDAIDMALETPLPLTDVGQWYCPLHRGAARWDKGGHCPRYIPKNAVHKRAGQVCNTALRRVPYVAGWDIGRHQDPSVGIVLDIASNVHSVAKYVRLHKQPYPHIATAINQMLADFPGIFLVVEKNSAGEAVVEMSDAPEGRVELHHTSQASKARALDTLRGATHEETIRWPSELDQLTGEMRNYQLPDDAITQDSVIALSIAEEYSGPATLKQGVVGTPFNV